MSAPSFQSAGPTRMVGYIRCSTDEQEASGLGLRAQRDAISAECQLRGWQLVRIEEDVASGTRLDRPGLTAAVEAVANGDAEGLITAKLDRLSRSVVHFSTLLEKFRSKGWGLVILDLGIDTTTVIGEAMATLAATFAQMERRRIGERTSAALAVLRGQGVTLGRPVTLPGHVDRRIWKARQSGETFASIANVLNERAVPTAHGGAAWHPATVRGVVLRVGRAQGVA